MSSSATAGVQSALLDTSTFKFYLLRLVKNGKVYTYKGMTNDPHCRIAKHNRICKGGADYTVMRCDATHRWEFFLIVTGFRSINEAEKFEKATKKKRSGRKKKKKTVGAAEDDESTPAKKAPKKRKPTGMNKDRDCDHELLQMVKRNQGGGPVHPSVMDVLKVLSMPKWSKPSPPACDVPLTMHWMNVQERPTMPSGVSYLKSYVQERDASSEERDAIYTRRPLERQWDEQYTVGEVLTAKRSNGTVAKKRKCAAAAAADDEEE